MDNKKKKRRLIIIGCIIVLLIIIVTILLVIKSNGYRVIKVENYDGTVTLERNSTEEDIFKGMSLKSKDTVTTGTASVIELLADSDKHILAKENTCFSINAKGNEKNGKIAINLKYGSSLVEIDNKLEDGSEFEVNTPNATASVRGTTFEVCYDKDKNETVIVVTEGVVEVKTATEKRMIDADKKVTITGDSGNMIEEFNTDEMIGAPVYTNEVAFELDKTSLISTGWHNDGKTGICVKKMDGWNHHRRLSGENNEFCSNSFNKDGISISYSAIDEDMFNYSDPSTEKYTISVEKMLNLDGDEITVETIDYSVDEISGYGYRLYKKIEDDLYLGIFIYVQDGDLTSSKIDLNVYLNITTDKYYVYNKN